MENKKVFLEDAWPEIYASRQTRGLVEWPVVGIEEHQLLDDKVLCLVVTKDRVKGLIPFEESGIKPGNNKRENRARMLKLLGQDIEFIVTAIDSENELFVGSRKAALEFKISRSDLREGATVTAIARRINVKSVVVEIEGLEAMLPAHEISHGWTDQIQDVIQPGDIFDVKIKELDLDEERILVSVKDLIPNPWPDAAKRYQRNGFYSGTVTGITRWGVFVELEPGVNALCRHMRSGVPQKGDEVAIVATRVSTQTKDGEQAGRISANLIRIVRRAAI